MATPGPLARLLGRHTGPVGFNPFRARQRSGADLAYVAAALAICVALLAWALFG